MNCGYQIRFLCLLAVTVFLSGSVFGRPLVVAHRGASHDAPENTMRAFDRAWDLGADGIEGDFRLSKDGHIVAMHDADTMRVTGGSANLNVASSTLAELRGLDVGKWKGERFSGERIPTFAEIIKSVPIGKKFFIENI